MQSNGKIFNFASKRCLFVLYFNKTTPFTPSIGSNDIYYFSDKHTENHLLWRLSACFDFASET